MGEVNESWEQRAMLTADYLKGQSFHRQEFALAGTSDDHDHCRMCGKKIGTKELQGVDLDGFATLLKFEYDGFPATYQWAWVCVDCFDVFKARMEWSVSVVAPRYPKEEILEFHRVWTRKAREARNKMLESDDTIRYAHSYWTSAAVVGIGKLNGILVSEEEAVELLERNERRLLMASDEACSKLILDVLMKQRGRARTGDGE